MHPLSKLDIRFVWHPFTQMRDWVKREPIVIVEGTGAVLRDVHGKEYLDANSSIWTNLHGHNHAALNQAVVRQLRKIAHSSALGLANEPASLLAKELISAASLPPKPARKGRRGSPPCSLSSNCHIAGGADLAKVFFSDDGSTAMEVALKLAYQVTIRSRPGYKPRFLSLQGAYHGDTVGAVSLGHIDLFHSSYGGLLFKSDTAPAPYCYRCPHNRAGPERADARVYRKCGWECVRTLEKIFERRKKQRKPYAAFIFEPLIQGAAGMIAQPAGWLSRASQVARGHGALLIADEVMTGFGRTGSAGSGNRPVLFASLHEGVIPDLMALAKGLTGGYLPMAATLTSKAIFDAFSGEYEEFKTFFHGHSYTGNQLAAAAALASLRLLRSRPSIDARARVEETLRSELQRLWTLPPIGDIRQVGLIAGIELVRDFGSREPYDLRERAGIRVCEAMAGLGVLTRPIGNVIVLMPPYCSTAAQIRRMVAALAEAVAVTLQHRAKR